MLCVHSGRVCVHTRNSQAITVGISTCHVHDYPPDPPPHTHTHQAFNNLKSSTCGGLISSPAFIIHKSERTCLQTSRAECAKHTHLSTHARTPMANTPVAGLQGGGWISTLRVTTFNRAAFGSRADFHHPADSVRVCDGISGVTHPV